MPDYEFRCKSCANRFVVFYKSFADYDAASSRCLDCGSSDLTRIITKVAIGKSNRDFSNMSSQEMLSVLESGDERQVDKLFRQVGETGKQKPSPSGNETKHGDESGRDRGRTPGAHGKKRSDNG